MATKGKKAKTVVIDNSKVDNDVEFDIFQEKLNDQMVDAFTGTKSIATLVINLIISRKKRNARSSSLNPESLNSLKYIFTRLKMQVNLFND